MPALPLPHERDERPELAHATSPAIAQAATDLAAGRVDTDNYTRAAQVTGFAGRTRKARR